ncbi:hypothetical protein [Paucibacter soli]|uniref:hypothetical protein n=1 Tax=Paucibacter soli TaxID=3133433 RepID=UPI0030952A81
MNFNYRLNCGQYVLHDGDRPVRRVLDEVSLAFTETDGVLVKHGDPESVQKWVSTTQGKYRAAGFEESAAGLVCITGRFPLEDLNRCLSTTGFVLNLYARLKSGELGQQPLLEAPPMRNPLPRRPR